MNSLSYKKVGALFSGVVILFFIIIGATSNGEKRVSLDESLHGPTETIPVEQLPTHIIEQAIQVEPSTENEFQNEEVEQDTPTPIPTVNIQKNQQIPRRLILFKLSKYTVVAYMIVTAKKRVLIFHLVQKLSTCLTRADAVRGTETMME